ncbi:hypothetical protein ACO0SA_003079 [Hanseniaspora valbyensis]
MSVASEPILPAIIVGSGLAGLTVSDVLINQYNLKNVTIVDKNPKVGGNSIKASSGISAADTKQQHDLKIEDDSADIFYNDILKSTGQSPNVDQLLINKLSVDSKHAVEYLTEKHGLKLDKISKLGGHSVRRTHKSSNGIPPGYEMISTLEKSILKKIEEDDNNDKNVNFKMNTKLINFTVHKDTSIKEVTFMDISTGKTFKLKTNNLVLATGGFSANKNLIGKILENEVNKLQNKDHDDDSIISKKLILSKLATLPTSNGEFASGDLINLLLGKPELSCQFRDLSEIQIHPTGFIDPSEPDSLNKILAGEQLRGNGGILVNPTTGGRFVNELDTRDKVSKAIFDQNLENDIVYLVLSEKGGEANMDTLGFYMKKGLVEKTTPEQLFSGADTHKLSKFVSEIRSYSILHDDRFGRDFKMNSFETDFDKSSTIYVGKVTPILHYTMGGLAINENGLILNNNDDVVDPGFYAVGEQTGGIHGKNRLGGCSLLESVVFGLEVGKSIGDKFTK